MAKRIEDQIIKAKSTYWHQDELGKVLIILTKDHKLLFLDLGDCYA